MDYINQWSGKPQPFSAFPRSSPDVCDECGTKLILDCPICGAPNCCPKCCEEAQQEAKVDLQTTTNSG